MQLEGGVCAYLPSLCCVLGDTIYLVHVVPLLTSDDVTLKNYVIFHAS